MITAIYCHLVLSRDPLDDLVIRLQRRIAFIEPFGTIAYASLRSGGKMRQWGARATSHLSLNPPREWGLEVC